MTESETRPRQRLMRYQLIVVVSLSQYYINSQSVVHQTDEIRPHYNIIIANNCELVD